MDFFEVGDKTSLICTDIAIRDGIRAALRELELKSHFADTADGAIERLRSESYDLVMIQEGFGRTPSAANPVSLYLAGTPMSQRRFSLIVLVGPGFKTLDAIQAFANSVHLVMNTADLPNLSAVLKRSWAEFESVYRVYRKVLETIA